MAAKLDRVPREKVLQRALQLATEAMDLLDAHATEPEAAAYIALAQERLRTALTRD
jgi:hypothetical protein